MNIPEDSSEKVDTPLTSNPLGLLEPLVSSLRRGDIYNLYEWASSVLSAEELIDKEDNRALYKALGVSLWGVAGTNPVSSGPQSNYIITQRGNGLDAVKETVPWALTADQLLENVMSAWASRLSDELENPNLNALFKQEGWQKNAFMPKELRVYKSCTNTVGTNLGI